MFQVLFSALLLLLVDVALLFCITAPAFTAADFYKHGGRFAQTHRLSLSQIPHVPCAQFAKLHAEAAWEREAHQDSWRHPVGTLLLDRGYHTPVIPLDTFHLKSNNAQTTTSIAPSGAIKLPQGQHLVPQVLVLEPVTCP